MDEETGISHIRIADEPSGWIEASVQFVHADEEAVASFVADCVELGAVGSRETSEALEPGHGPAQACASCTPVLNIQAYFPDSFALPEIADLLESRTRAFQGAPGSPDARARTVRCRRIAREEWATGWQGGFPPERVAGSFWVVPPWHSPSIPEGAVPMILEPGQAFGTGKHATTRHCLEFLEEIARQRADSAPSFLDAGCGSGILSIAALLLGSSRVVGLDIDFDTLGVARRNLQLNGLGRRVLLVNGTPESIRPRFHLIAANLDATTLMRYRDALWEALEEGGMAVLSGMLADQAPEVAAAFQTLGARAVGRKKDPEEGWTSLLLKKRL